MQFKVGDQLEFVRNSRQLFASYGKVRILQIEHTDSFYVVYTTSLDGAVRWSFRDYVIKRWVADGVVLHSKKTTTQRDNLIESLKKERGVDWKYY